MSLNLNITSKLLQYFYTPLQKGSRIVYSNVLDPSKTVSTKAFKGQKNLDRYTLIDLEGTFLNKKECKFIHNAMKMQSWMYQKLGIEDYKRYHTISKIRTFSEYLRLNSYRDLIKLEPIEESLKLAVIAAIEEYLKNKEEIKKELLLQYVSKDKNSITPLNEIANRYLTKKENCNYYIKVDQEDPASQLKNIRAILDQFVLNNHNTEYLLN